MLIPKPNKSTFKPVPAGAHPAVCYRVLHLGTQDSYFQGQHSRKEKILVTWEIQAEDAIMDDGRPMSISKPYTWSLHEKATLRKDLESWRGKKFTDEDFEVGGFDVKKLLGVPCMLSIVHNEGNDGQTYANVSGIMKLPKNFETLPLTNQKAYLWIAPKLFDETVFSTLGERLQEKIKNSPEYKIMVDGVKPAAKVDYSNLDDEIPF